MYRRGSAVVKYCFLGLIASFKNLNDLLIAP